MPKTQPAIAAPAAAEAEAEAASSTFMLFPSCVTFMLQHNSATLGGYIGGDGAEMYTSAKNQIYCKSGGHRRVRTEENELVDSRQSMARIALLFGYVLNY
jgi:hypothetical protein